VWLFLLLHGLSCHGTGLVLVGFVVGLISIILLCFAGDGCVLRWWIRVGVVFVSTVVSVYVCFYFCSCGLWVGLWFNEHS